MAEIDKRGSFYLGRPHDLASGQTGDEPLLYDSAQLTTHAVCVGMTGSGKTGLCLALLEEAALDGVPAIAIDPKGDLGNLLLAFPELRPEDFRPWIDESLAVREGISPDEFAAKTADQWTNGLAQWGEDGERIRRYKNAVDCAIYTPGSSAGLPLTVLKSFNAPPPAVLDDADAFGDRVQSAASGVLALLGVDADPVNSREHILLSKVLQEAWSAGRDLDLAAIIGEIQKPSFKMVGAVPVDGFLASKERDALAMKLNNLLASPSFASWLTGEPLDVERLLYSVDEAGRKKPRLSILSIAHLGDDERMFFVTLLLNEVISWVRSQPGTSSLRAILYMDEVFGYFPPTANPPAKRPMLTLLKQARAYGLGCVLATQNPVDLDYKGLSNAGTWFLGRLQTERDKARVLEGLEGASTEAGAKFNRAEMERSLAALGKRVFLMNNVHEQTPTVFHTRWALSYLAGPLTRDQIRKLMADRRAVSVDAGGVRRVEPTEPATPVSRTAPKTPPTTGRPLLAGDISQRFWPFADASSVPDAATLTYRPGVLGVGRVHYVSAAENIDVWRDVAALQAIDEALPQPLWSGAVVVANRPELADQPRIAGEFAELPGPLGQSKTYAMLKRELADWLYQSQRFARWTCAELGESSRAEETEEQFRIRAAPLVQELRKQQAIKQRAAELSRLEKELDAAEADRAEHRWWFASFLVNAMSRIAEILITSLIGRRSRKQVVTATAWNQAMKSRRLAGQAKKSVKQLATKIENLKAEEQAELQRLSVALPPGALQLTKIEVPPRKSDIDVDEVLLVWLPWRQSAGGEAQPAYEIAPS